MHIYIYIYIYIYVYRVNPYGFMFLGARFSTGNYKISRNFGARACQRRASSREGRTQRESADLRGIGGIGNTYTYIYLHIYTYIERER